MNFSVGTPGVTRDLRVHRDLLQRNQEAFDPRLRESERVRATGTCGLINCPRKRGKITRDCSRRRVLSETTRYSCTIPRRAAAAIASVRLSTLSLVKILLRWALTVASLMNRLRPISLLLCPDASDRSTSISRSVSSAPLNRSASFAATDGGKKVSPLWTR